ncbi:MAG TPA: alpha/beta hydrolase [Burkholderiales bacterium]|nr:alpha/beta hydrolase [Burkholderiales bacterium]
MQLTVENNKAFAYNANRAFDPARPNVVFIHGAANDHSVWALQSRYFAYHGWNAFAVDLPGHGKSGGSPRHSVGALSDWVMAFMDAAGVKTAALVGHSMGSLVALETAARHPDRVSKVAMIGTSVPIAVSEPLLNASKANDHVAYEMINLYAHSSGAQLGGNRVPGMWMMGSAMRLMERSSDGVLHADFSACNDYTVGLDAAQKVKSPILFILGKRDLMTPMKVAKDVIARLPQAKVVALEGAGHSIMAERPDDVLDNLIAFLG